jgi:hypothetical protein
MKAVMVTRAQRQVLLQLSRQEINAIRRNPKLVSGAKHLLVACKKIILRVQAIPEYASRKKRATAHKRIVALCQKAIERAQP